MSYRAFKRLLGETSLERKCRFLLGAGIVLLLTITFWLYARQNESLAYDQLTTSSRLLVTPAIARLHDKADLLDSFDQHQRELELLWPEALTQHQLKFLSLRSRDPARRPEGDELTILSRFANDGQAMEESRLFPAESAFYYYGAVRADVSCIRCHTTMPGDAEKPALAVGDLVGVVRIRISSKAIESAVHQNRAILISTAILTALLIMAGCYVIVRYVIVKPLKHLKDVSDAIAAGELNIRADIQTGDEFEDLSDAFNRMLRNLMDKEQQYRVLNSDLDRKVDELAQANMSLFESNRLKGHFLATVSHELRTPLNSILGFSDVLLSSAQVLNEKQARWVDNIRTSGQQLLNLINDILDLARIEAGKMEVRPEEMSLSDLFDGLLTMFRPLAGRKNIELVTQFGSAVPLVRHDPGKLRQILNNLVSNAIKFTPEGGRVILRADTDGPSLILTVTDTGVGIAPEDRDAVFEKFRQAGTVLTREHEGTGLGLSIVRELCKLLGGDVSLQSELGRGSAFRVNLPMRTGSEMTRSDDTLPVMMLPSISGLSPERSL